MEIYKKQEETLEFGEPRKVVEEITVYIVNGTEYRNKESAERAEYYYSLEIDSVSTLHSYNNYHVFKVKSVEDINFISSYEQPPYKHDDFMSHNEEYIKELKFPCCIFLEQEYDFRDDEVTLTWIELEEIEKSHDRYIREYNEFKKRMEGVLHG